MIFRAKAIIYKGFAQIFWIQNSRLFPDPFQNNSFFFQTQDYQIGDQ